MFTTAAAASNYTLAGNATITLASGKTGARFTYNIKGKRDEDGKKTKHPKLFFVSLLTGPDNTSDYQYLGLLQHTPNGLAFRLTKNSCAKDDAPSVKAFRFYHQQVLAANHLPHGLEVRHEGSCGRCGRALTVPESIDRGIGPECATKM